MALTIAISGSHGSGKTTLCYELAAELKKRDYGVGLVTESARSSHHLIADEKSPEMHLEVFSLHLVSEMRSRRIHPVVLCDRSVFDFITYARIRFPDYLTNPDHFLLRAMDSFAAEFHKNYDLLLLTSDSYGNPENDKFRSRERVPTRDFDSTLRTVVSEFDVRHFELPRDKRIEAALEFIEPLLARP